jgi:hypothetical protein
MPKSKLQYLIEGFEAMNTSMLEVVLDENRTYQEARKDVFLEKIAAAFEDHKESGDTCLTAYFGICNSDLCENKGCTGYSFVGNNSLKHIDLVVKTEKDEIVDLFNCNGLVTEDESVKRKELQFINISIDEMANFKPSVETLIIFQEIDSACAELMAYEDAIIDKSIYLTWLIKYKQLYQDLRGKFVLYKRTDLFHSIYFGLAELKDFLDYEKDSERAVYAFRQIDTTNEESLLKWLVQYEYLLDSLVLFLYDEIDFEYPEKGEYFAVANFKIKTADFKYIANFKFHFDNYYWDMLEKYSTLSKEEIQQIQEEGTQEANNTNSLTFHLMQRGIKF